MQASAETTPFRPSHPANVELWRETLRPHAHGVVVNFAAILAVSAALRDSPLKGFGTWLAFSLLITGLRLAAWWHGRLQIRLHPDGKPDRVAALLLPLSVIGTAVSWCYLGWWALPKLSGPPWLTVIVVLCALAGGVTGSLAAMRISPKVYILLLAIPSNLQLLQIGGTSGVTLAALGLAFCWVLLWSHENNHQVLLRSIALADEKAALLLALSAKTEQVLAVNAELEDRVHARTQELHHIANHDLLTGLLNRRGLFEFHAPTPNQHSEHVAVLFVDLDRFKHINDEMGHEWGDRLLHTLAERLQALAGSLTLNLGCPAPLVCRWGGDEFVVVIAGDLPDDEELLQRVKHLQEQLSLPYHVHSRTLKVGASVGVARQPMSPLFSLPQALANADSAVSEAKRLGRGRVIAYNEALAALQRRRLQILVALTEAHQSDGLTLMFQPIVAASNGRVVAREALLRWHCPGIGNVSPVEFIPLAEESDHIQTLGVWAMRRACQSARTWDEPAPKVAVNVSIRQLVQPDFSRTVESVLAETGLRPSQLVIEVTESVFVEESMQQVLNTLRGLRDCGVEIHIDDFGTGYSSLSRLSEFPLSAVKIDKSFVLTSDERALTVIEGTVLIAHKFGLRVIAEGVETEASASRLRTVGVDELQGYHFGRPQTEQ